VRFRIPPHRRPTQPPAATAAAPRTNPRWRRQYPTIFARCPGATGPAEGICSEHARRCRIVSRAAGRCRAQSANKTPLAPCRSSSPQTASALHDRRATNPGERVGRSRGRDFFNVRLKTLEIYPPILNRRYLFQIL
jgi:hypothetical protein